MLAMERTFECTLCSKKIGTKGNLNRHIATQHEGIVHRQKLFKCNLGDKEFSRKDDLINHTRTHTGERPFKCSVHGCEKGFKQPSNLRDHMNYKHNDDRPFTCRFQGCCHTDKTWVGLKSHMKVHSDDRPFACPTAGCNFRAKRVQHVSRHVSGVHSKDQTFSCPKCSYKTARKDSLKAHEKRRHSTRRDFKCSNLQCTKSFKMAKELKTHVRNEHEGRSAHHPYIDKPLAKSFQCPLCFKSYVSLRNLQSHSFAHTNEKPLKCGHCDFATSYRNCLQRHISVVHTKVKVP